MEGFGRPVESVCGAWKCRFSLDRNRRFPINDRNDPLCKNEVGGHMACPDLKNEIK